MRALSLLREAVNVTRHEWRRSVLTALSLVLGVASVVAVQVASAVTGDWLLYQQEVAGTRQGAATVVLELSPSQVRSLLAVVGADGDRMTALWNVGDEVRTRGATSDGRAVEVVGYAGSLTVAKPFRVVQGEPTPGVMANEALASARPTEHGGLVMADQTVRPLPRIDAVVADLVPDPRLYLRHEGTWPLPAATGTVQVAYYGSIDNRAALAARLASVDLPGEGITIADPASQIQRTMTLVTAVFMATAAVTLLVGILGILNIGLVTVRERATELALRRCLGASSGEIGLLVVFEAGIVGIVGAAAALLIALLAYQPTLAALGIRATPFPLQAAIAAIIAGAAAGLLGGLIPAIRAARRPLADVMRA